MGRPSSAYFGAPSNDWGVEVFALRDSEREHGIQVFHGVSIGMGVATPGSPLGAVTVRPVGRVSSWQPQVYTRDFTPQFELSSSTFGKQVDGVPGRNSAYSVSCTRTEVWKNEMEVATGLVNSSNDVYEDLMDQDRPFQSDEVLLRSTSPYRHWRYLGCWYTELNPSGFEAEGGDVRITRTASFNFIRRARVL